MTDKTHPGNSFEDFAPGQILNHAGARTVTDGDHALYLALTGDRHPLYCDAEFARALGYISNITNDLLVFHIVFGKSVPDISLNAIANLGYADLRFLQPVYSGDTLRAQSEVIGIKQNRNGKSGIVYVHTHGLNQRDEVVVQFYRWVMVRKRDESAPAPDPSIPELPSEVAPDAFTIDETLSPDTIKAARWPGPNFYEDYEAGERIHHGPGTTIEEAEHALATRLYQNTARVHFDGHYMQKSGSGKRLVYGGHVISLAHAMAYSGIENALRILAWNGGTHANPLHAGDTLYAFTDVLESKAIPNRDDLGALRLRLVGVKNHDPQEESLQIRVTNPENGRETYHSNVVLDLDYYVLVPRKP
ncbi:MAG: MaoC family dehydratase [Candidatus Hydrogenedentes bacterium]|nr:MaoC family dehydratase [Candidatus Hydrogenedentota bacterium]